MKSNTLLAGFVILTLLVGFSSGNFVNLAYADEDDDRDEEYDDDRYEDDDREDELKERAEYQKDQKEKFKKYGEEQKDRAKKLQEERKEKLEKYKEEQQNRLDKSKKELQDKLEKYREESGEKQKKYRDEAKTYKHEIKLKYKDLKTDYREQYEELKDKLKEKLRELHSSDELTEDELLSFEEKRLELEMLKKEFREKIMELKTQARQDIVSLKQDYIKHDQDRKDKVHDKLNQLKLKFKDRIKEHRTDLIQDGNVDYINGKKVMICHIPPGNTENAHPIRVSVNAMHAHMGHGDVPGDCVLIPDDGTPDEGSKEVTGTLKIKKITLDGVGDEFDFAVTSNTTTIIPSFALNTTDTGMNMTDAIEVIQGSYNITEALPDDWSVVSVECNGNLLGDETVAGESVNVTVAATETVECIFTNEKTETTGTTGNDNGQ